MAVCGLCVVMMSDADGAGGLVVNDAAAENVDNAGPRLFTNDSDDGRRGGLFAAFLHDDDDDDATNVTASNAFSFLAGFDTSVADMSVASDGGGFQFAFGDDTSHTSDEDNPFSLF